ncbi:hypothetical protein RR46_08255 [Papilio xuthus]|uniref:Uncharacterized protein n=1 Tax=Papilio xuthus TaxID=66420 RepID=A0A194PGJ3_PAPXU|nr:hypothetical protein RR46_08255 [Papilio xuthus]
MSGRQGEASEWRRGEARSCRWERGRAIIAGLGTATRAAPMFAGMRGVHQQMLSGGTLTATSISGLGSFGHHLTTSLPTLPPDRKPSTPLSGLGPPPTSLPPPVPPPSTSTTVHSYYDHMI